VATLTLAETADLALETIGIKAVGQSATTEDRATGEAAVTRVHAMLRAEELAPFATSDVPEWAQEALIHLAALSMCTNYGITGARKAEVEKMAAKGRVDMATQASGANAQGPIRTRYY
jgi:hypothetical protein